MHLKLCYRCHFFESSTKEMGTNDVCLWQAASTKCPKTQFKIGSFLSCLLCVDTKPVHPLSSDTFLCSNVSEVIFKWTNKQSGTRTGLNLKKYLIATIQTHWFIYMSCEQCTLYTSVSIFHMYSANWTFINYSCSYIYVKYLLSNV